MTISELIINLQALDGDLPVRSYSDGNTPIEIEYIDVKRDNAGEFVVFE